MKAIVSLALPVCAVLLAACGGTKDTAAAVPASRGEFDPSTGSWRPLTKVVAPPPHERGATIVAQEKPGVMQKVGSTLKKPLEWVGLAKEDPPSASTASAPVTTTKKTAPPE